MNGGVLLAFAEALAETGGRLLQLSTAFVFNGQQGSPYRPEQTRDPLGAYGHTKAAGEEAVEQVEVDCPVGAIFDVPVGLAHGFLTLSDHAEVPYKASGFWSKTCQRSLRWNDPEVGITWPLEALGISEPVLADKDAAAPSLAEAVAAREVLK